MYQGILQFKCVGEQFSVLCTDRRNLFLSSFRCIIPTYNRVVSYLTSVLYNNNIVYNNQIVTFVFRFQVHSVFNISEFRTRLPCRGRRKTGEHRHDIKYCTYKTYCTTETQYYPLSVYDLRGSRYHTRAIVYAAGRPDTFPVLRTMNDVQCLAERLLFLPAVSRSWPAVLVDWLK